MSESHVYNPDASRALPDAAFVCDVARVRTLLRQGADPNARDAEGRTPLHSAVLGGSTELMEMLLSAGADINAPDAAGWTPLHFTAEEHLPHLAERLLEAGADPDARDHDGNSVLWRAVFSARGRGAMVLLLLAHGAKPDLANLAGETPRDLVARLEDSELESLFQTPSISLQLKPDGKEPH